MIFDYIKNSSEDFFTTILGLTVQECKTSRYNNLYCSEISIYKNEKKLDVIFFFNKNTICLISDILLFDSNPDKESRFDLLKEVANLIVGKAKSLIEEIDEDSIYKISTPRYIGKVRNIREYNLSRKVSQKIQNRCFVIGIKEI